MPPFLAPRTGPEACSCVPSSVLDLAALGTRLCAVLVARRRGSCFCRRVSASDREPSLRPAKEGTDSAPKVARNRLIALHGFTLEGAVMRRQMGPLAEQLERDFEVVYPDAPHACPASEAERLWRRLPPPRGLVAPRAWWRASANGGRYEGWQESVESLRSLLADDPPAGVIGFSQGAMLAALLAALSSRAEIPRLAFVVLIAGAVPRSDDLKGFFRAPIRLPSLHAMGRRDELMKERPRELAACFQEETRQIVEFDGAHVVPRRGPAERAIAHFCRSVVQRA